MDSKGERKWIKVA